MSKSEKNEGSTAVLDAPAITEIPKKQTAMIEIPLLRSKGTYVPRTIRRALAVADAQTLKDVLDALLVTDERLRSGKKVVDCDDALGWILEQIREANA